jgi:hypothetical protein
LFKTSKNKNFTATEALFRRKNRRKVTHYYINKRRNRDYFSFFMKKGVPLHPQNEITG